MNAKPSADLQRISLSLPSGVVRKFDQYFASKGIGNRSQACELILRDYLTHACLDDRLEVSGVLLVIYTHTKRNLLQQLADLQHEFHSVIVSTQHLHMSADRSLQAILVKGTARDINSLADRLRAIKGIKLSRSLVSIVD